mmetsp:Transcript_117242/g.250546  ORF Transcript_117242/g.250546 Transcript_117242/m.250546 type:complete len:200 (-) Transcript_117242:679-1278(-)
MSCASCSLYLRANYAADQLLLISLRVVGGACDNGPLVAWHLPLPGKGSPEAGVAPQMTLQLAMRPEPLDYRDRIGQVDAHQAQAIVHACADWHPRHHCRQRGHAADGKKVPSTQGSYEFSEVRGRGDNAAGSKGISGVPRLPCDHTTAHVAVRQRRRPCGRRLKVGAPGAHRRNSRNIKDSRTEDASQRATGQRLYQET